MKPEYPFFAPHPFIHKLKNRPLTPLATYTNPRAARGLGDGIYQEIEPAPPPPPPGEKKKETVIEMLSRMPSTPPPPPSRVWFQTEPPTQTQEKEPPPRSPHLPSTHVL